MSTAIVWFRRDLRLADNPALTYATKHYEQVVALYIHDEESANTMGAASGWWLHHSLAALDTSLNAKGSRLIIRQGQSLAVLLDVIKESKAEAVFWNRQYEPVVIKRDKLIKETLLNNSVIVKSFNGSLLNEPWIITKADGSPYKVFTAYMKACVRQNPFNYKPLKTPTELSSPTLKSNSLKKLGLLPTIAWDTQFYNLWAPGEVGAYAALDAFKIEAVNHYSQARDIPAIVGTSHLSPHLAFGEISPHAICSSLMKNELTTDADAYIRQLYWRDFANYLLFHFPQTVDAPLDNRFSHFPWKKNTKKELAAWQQGRTGIPIIDAGMRELWVTGWMHNRVRMIVASFLCKNLRISWQTGAQWFWDTLVDADLANNTMGWQWVAGCGADAAPYFRIFNPVLQGEKFDGDGNYVKKWVPELANLPKKYIHAPWLAPVSILTERDVTLGKTYPLPLADLSQSRAEALTAFSQMKSM